MKSLEPVSPSRLRPELPRDLETICLKCLSKEPRQRYQSAEELAEDLRRHLKMEPIKARRISFTGRAIRWCRRNPLLAAVTGSAAAVILILTSVYYFNLVFALEDARTAGLSHGQGTEQGREQSPRLRGAAGTCGKEQSGTGPRAGRNGEASSDSPSWSRNEPGTI